MSRRQIRVQSLYLGYSHVLISEDKSDVKFTLGNPSAVSLWSSSLW